jgi:hypothetical protein
LLLTNLWFNRKNGPLFPGNPAVSVEKRPVAFCPRLATGLAFTGNLMVYISLKPQIVFVKAFLALKDFLTKLTKEFNFIRKKFIYAITQLDHCRAIARIGPHLRVRPVL